MTGVQIFEETNMLIFTLDDEALLLKQSESVIKEAAPDAEVMAFRRSADALAAISEQGVKPDVVFSDIEMPGLNGLAFAAKLKELSPDTVIVFVTAYSQYALEAFRVHARGYVLKPLDADRVREELASLPSAISGGGAKPAVNKLQVRCFGHFEVFWKGEPLIFARRQTKELFAFLIDNEGRTCRAEEIVSALWEEEYDIGAAKTRLRNLVFDLKNTLAEIGMEDALIRRSGLIAIKRDMVDCDYYRMLDGDMDAVNSYRGEYMTQYSWAEVTAGSLYFGK